MPLPYPTIMSYDLTVIDLFSKIEELPGIGTSYGAMLKRQGISQVRDLIWLTPRKVVDFKIAEEPTEGEIALNLTIRSSIERGPSTFLNCATDSGKTVKVIFFSKSKLFYKGSRICVFGTIKLESGALTMSHPKWHPGTHERFVLAEYPVKVPPAILAKAMSFILKNLDFGEWIDEETLKSRNWTSFSSNLEKLHFHNEKKPPRLQFDEAIAHSYSLEMAFRPEKEGIYSIPPGDTSDFLNRLGFPLTPDQQSSWEEIRADLASEERMLRILYGDVGSGKTFVAFLALLSCYRSGRQAALLAPTEILARQHFELLSGIMPEENIVLLTSKGTKTSQENLAIDEAKNENDSEEKETENKSKKSKSKKAKKKSIYDKIASENCIIIGTHAILQDSVNFNSLGLLVIDEQHRFGVLQRMAINRELCYNVLLMTATPIPRTLKLSSIGPLKISRILTRPQKNRSIDVRVLYEDRIPDIYNKIESLLVEGDSIFWVCPFIQKSECKKGMDVLSRWTDLQLRFGETVTFLHGRMDPTTKQQILEDFFAGKKRILVSTTVIEVGINIPHANTMVIENSELFGLAQLYQLMGRVGRGDAPGRCYFVYSSKNAAYRLSILQRCKSGLEIAESDLKIRGFGNLLGSEQTGFFGFRFLNLEKDDLIINQAKEYVKQKIGNPDFEKHMPTLLELFSFLEDPWHGG